MTTMAASSWRPSTNVVAVSAFTQRWNFERESTSRSSPSSAVLTTSSKRSSVQATMIARGGPPGEMSAATRTFGSSTARERAQSALGPAPAAQRVQLSISDRERFVAVELRARLGALALQRRGHPLSPARQLQIPRRLAVLECGPGSVGARCVYGQAVVGAASLKLVVVGENSGDRGAVLQPHCSLEVDRIERPHRPWFDGGGPLETR